MTTRAFRPELAWLLTLSLAIAFVIGTALTRNARTHHLTAIGLEAQPVDPASVSGREGGTRELILPETSLGSAHWILQTQQMLATGAWRIRSIDYENAPQGREVSTPSPYRWWLATVAWGMHLVSGEPMAPAVERAALWADPVLLVLLLIGAAFFVRVLCGGYAAALTAAGLATLFPFAVAFQPGAPDGSVLVLVAATATVLPIAAAVTVLATTAGASTNRRQLRVCFAAAGAAGGLLTWLSVAAAVPMLLGITVGGALAAWRARAGASLGAAATVAAAPWWWWAGAGAIASLGGFLAENAPEHLATWVLRVNHPLYALAWIGAGAVCAGATACLASTGRPPARTLVLLGAGLAALAVVPVTMLVRDDPGFLVREAGSFALSRFSEEGVASSLAAWIARDGVGRLLIAACLPLAFIAAGAWLLRSRAAAGLPAAAVALTLGPVATALAFSIGRLGTWALLDVTLLALVVVVAVLLPQARPGARGLVTALTVVACAFGATQVVRPLAGGTARPVEALEFGALVHRDLAHWLARRTHGAEPVVLAPPDESLAFAYYGGIRSLGTPDWQNRDGVQAATRMLRATSAEEAQALFEGRGVTHVILPSWDTTLQQLAGPGSGDSGSFLGALKQLSLPAWMRPIPYQLPEGAQGADRSVIVLEIGEEQPEALELSRLAEYFVEMNRPEYATAVAQSLKRFPADLGAWVARVQVEMATGQQPAKAPSLPTLVSMVENGADRVLAWDRRAALAIVLARGQRNDLAREQVRRCLATASEEQLRSLTSSPLYRLLYLARSHGLEFPDPELARLAPVLLPHDLRERLGRTTAK
jgi:hypothetical protein